MTRLRTDQACLEAQMQQQIAQNLNAELAVPCPDCGVESGRACRDSLDRAVRTHLARSVAANRRDTEPCPAPSILIDRHALADGDYDGMSLKSLERASARAFAESLRAEVDRANAACICCLESPGADGVIAHRPLCFYKTPTASDCAPSPAASAPEADCNGVAPSRGDSGRPVCACGQTVWGSGGLDFDGTPICSDCSSDKAREYLGEGKPAPLDKRIAEAKSDDATECAWSTPTSDGEGWRNG